jgi:hypothetical protein
MCKWINVQMRQCENMQMKQWEHTALAAQVMLIGRFDDGATLLLNQSFIDDFF